MQQPHEALEVLIAACNEALDADNVFTGEGTGARRKIRAAVAEVEKMIDAQEVLEEKAREETPPPSKRSSAAGGSGSGPGAGKH